MIIITKDVAIDLSKSIAFKVGRYPLEIDFSLIVDFPFINGGDTHGYAVRTGLNEKLSLELLDVIGQRLSEGAKVVWLEDLKQEVLEI